MKGRRRQVAWLEETCSLKQEQGSNAQGENIKISYYVITESSELCRQERQEYWE